MPPEIANYLPGRAPAPFTTFYSFKGGVGRSMALINVAGILAGRGFRVLVVDVDLEAPGISYLLTRGKDKSNSTLPGFIDLLGDAVARGDEADLFKNSPDEVVEQYSHLFEVPSEIQRRSGGYLRIMPAGRLDGGYQQRLEDLNLPVLYREGYGQTLIATFKQKIQDAQRFDFVLIDSRTGFSEESGVCTRDLADQLVVVTGLNHQNVEGTTQFLRVLRAAAGPSKRLMFVLSPIPNGEDELVDTRLRIAEKSFQEAWGAAVDLHLQIPYHPRLALTEEPHIFRRNHGYLYDAYTQIEEQLLSQLGLTAKLREEVIAAVRTEDFEEATKKLSILVKLDNAQSLPSLTAQLSSKVGLAKADLKGIADIMVRELPINSWAFEDWIIELLDAKKDAADPFLHRAVKSDPENADYMGYYAFFLEEVRKDYDLAEAKYLRAIELNPKHARNLFKYASFLEFLRKDFDQAEAIYLRAIEAHPKNAAGLGSYALFLEDVRRDSSRAEVMFQRALSIAPKDPNIIGNRAKLRFAQGRLPEARELIKQALALKPTKPDLLSELYFYEYAHDWNEWPEALMHLKGLLLNGARSPGWNLEANVARSRLQGHPAPDFVAALAKVISDEGPIESLDSFVEWTNAQAINSGGARTPPQAEGSPA